MEKKLFDWKKKSFALHVDFDFRPPLSPFSPNPAYLQELANRNSQQPPHMRSSYAIATAKFSNVSEDEFRNGKLNTDAIKREIDSVVKSSKSSKKKTKVILCYFYSLKKSSKIESSHVKLYQ